MFKAARRQLRSVAMLGVAAALVVGGVAVAQEGSDGSSSQGQKNAAGKQGRPPGPPPGGTMMPLKGLTYGEFHVQTKSGEDQVIRIDEGKVTAVSADSVTVLENDGNEVTIAVDEDTEVLGKPGSDTALEDLEGKRVTVSGPSGEAADAIGVMPKKGDLPKGGPGQLPTPPGMGQGSE